MCDKIMIPIMIFYVKLPLTINLMRFSGIRYFVNKKVKCKRLIAYTLYVIHIYSILGF